MSNCYPKALLQGDRKPDNAFNTDEKLFVRFNKMAAGGKLVSHTSIRATQSFNREKYSEPEWVTYFDCPNHLRDGYGYLEVNDTFIELISSGKKPHHFRVEHKPLELNYSHSELCVYGDKDYTISKKNINNKIIDTDVRMRLAKVIHVLKAVGEEPSISHNCDAD